MSDKEFFQKDMSDLSNRVGRVEGSMDKLVDIVSKAAESGVRFEERMANVVEKIERGLSESNHLSNRMSDIEIKIASELATKKDIEKLSLSVYKIRDSVKHNSFVSKGIVYFWCLIVSSVVGFITYMFRG